MVGEIACIVGEFLKTDDSEVENIVVPEEESKKIEELQTQTREKVEEMLSPEEKMVMKVMSHLVKGNFETMEDVKYFFNELNSKSTYVHKDDFLEEEDIVTMAYITRRINEFKRKIPHFEQEYLYPEAA